MVIGMNPRLSKVLSVYYFQGPMRLIEICITDDHILSHIKLKIYMYMIYMYMYFFN